MHVVVSMYFATGGSERMPVPVPHMDAEERLISSVCEAIVVSSSLLERHKECLVFGRPGIRITHRCCEEVRQRTGMALCAGVAPVDRKPDLPDAFPVAIQAC